MTGPILPATEVVVGGEEFHHAVRVARVREGEEVELFDGRGALASGKVRLVGRDHVTVMVEQELPSREARIAVHLAVAIIQLEKFELVLQKATELGVRSIIPLITDRVEIRPERYRGRAGRWEKIVFEAAKQCGRAVVPPVEPATTFGEAVKAGMTRIVFDADAAADPAPAALTEVTLLVGPEGGWSEEEIALARRSGCVFQRLGPRRLRAETAAIAATAIIAARHGDI
ncbi:MAG TPA: RsmE family RNA methyltransferase [Thermoanaerobaculia bacterium]|nr:RsmE family RNA methyltransferase [Thermoanaerobaculia bacterium]